MKDEIFYTPFYSSFLELCNKAGKSPSAVAEEAGISSGAPTAWKKGAVPKKTQRAKLCAYFDVSDDVLLGYKKETPPTPEGGGLDPLDMEALNLFRQLWPDNRKHLLEIAQSLLKAQEVTGGQNQSNS